MQQLEGRRRLADGGLAYTIDFSAADPSLYMPIIPFPEKTKLIGKRGDGEFVIPDAKFNDGSSTGGDSEVKVESLMPEDMYLGQIVPFEIEIRVEGLEWPENGEMQFTAGWSTITTSGDDFGYDEDIGVLAAFVDTGDGTHNDPYNDATVKSYSWKIVDENEIQGTFNLVGLDNGDKVSVEVWLVLDSKFPTGKKPTGNIHSRLISAKTKRNDSINTGTQTVPVMQVDSNKGGIQTPPSDLRIGYEDWIADYEPSSRARLGIASDDVAGVDDITLFCG
jgi:hypothetical protein